VPCRFIYSSPLPPIAPRFNSSALSTFKC
jgi:hypothetical protein